VLQWLNKTVHNHNNLASGRPLVLCGASKATRQTGGRRFVVCVLQPPTNTATCGKHEWCRHSTLHNIPGFGLRITYNRQTTAAAMQMSLATMLAAYQP